MDGVDMQEVMKTMSRIPDDPIPEYPRLREMLIEQILVFQSRYVFHGRKHTQESLAGETDRYLERLCNMQLYGIASSSVRDTLINGR